MAYPQLVSDYRTPQIKWYQTNLTVVICVQLTDVSDYYLRVEDDHLFFSTTTNNTEYCLILYFFGLVIAEKTTHKNVGREIKIYLTKGLKWFPWLRLITSKEKNLFISYDPDRLCMEEYDEETDSTNTSTFAESESQKPTKSTKVILPFDPFSDTEESEDEEDNPFYDVV